ncbi:hypothetical protein EVAR_10238_1 [Eumeta japonica]|uniref:Uncharacterized protein n=1 Tax=Eumeta variegata TaxID=151549 RepID=A0A4C1TDG7_EUMVA|nr:hypothetical protein EVAR_10238_1 [Eumeta japonica]
MCISLKFNTFISQTIYYPSQRYVTIDRRRLTSPAVDRDRRTIRSRTRRVRLEELRRRQTAFRFRSRYRRTNEPGEPRGRCNDERRRKPANGLRLTDVINIRSYRKNALVFSGRCNGARVEAFGIERKRTLSYV